jgi:leucyl/phenylalanyl-tRNA--protein transferase
MPIEPRPPGWVLPDVRSVPAGVELVAVGADLTAGMLLAGYRRGLFAMPDQGLLGWWSPDPRGILRPASLHVSRSLRRSAGRFTVSLDRCFDLVVEACADPRRPHGWISAHYRSAYAELHQLGWAHSIEVWDGAGRLAGGLFGVEVGGLFAAESKFHVATDASKVAVVALAELLSADGRPERFVDVQWRTEHLASLGVVEVPRTDYLAMLGPALALPPVLAAVSVSGPAPATAPPSRIRWRTG